jgi:hypothetical protein
MMGSGMLGTGMISSSQGGQNKTPSGFLNPSKIGVTDTSRLVTPVAQSPMNNSNMKFFSASGLPTGKSKNVNKQSPKQKQ